METETVVEKDTHHDSNGSDNKIMMEKIIYMFVC